MAGFLYFLPEQRHYSPSMLGEYGLSHILDAGDHIHAVQVIRGPDGLAGMLLGNRRSWTDSDVSWSDRLAWRKFPRTHADRQAFLCWLKDAPLPAPADLARRSQLSGMPLTLADDRPWLIPHARRWTTEGMMVTVPRTIDVDEESGEFVYGDVLPRYQDLWRRATDYWDALLAASEQASDSQQAEIEFVKPLDLIVCALAANYRVSRLELGVLQAMDDQLFESVASILIDLDGMHSISKKKVDGTGSG